jgi:asparagine synthase (glutamine-hydrolysing)
MSGICGIAFREQPGSLTPGHLSAMVRALDPARPGEDAVFARGVVGVAAQGFAGALSGVAKVVRNGQTSLLAFHGNLYNQEEIFPAEDSRSGLLEQMLSLCLERGVAWVGRIRGEFALAVWDGNDETLRLFTDRFRVQPLFYYEDGEKLIFASRLKAILAAPGATRRVIDPEAIVDVAGASFIPTPRSILSSIHKIPPGSVLTYRRGEIKIASYWDLDFSNGANRDERDLAAELRSQLTDAISVRLAADTDASRIGTFLSGGVDSSTVTGILTKLAAQPIKAFSIGFSDQAFNEIEYARIAARAFGAEHHEHFVTPEEAYEAVPIVLEAYDEPFANASAIPTYFCSKMAAEQGIEWLYAGDGGDELFAGNERYATQRLFDYYYDIPSLIREPLIRPLIFALAEIPGCGIFAKGKKYIKRASIPYPDRLTSYSFFNVFPLVNFFTDDFLAELGRDYDPYALTAFHYHRAQARTELDRQLYIDLKMAISDNDLFKVCRATEAAGVKVRFPFLDGRLAEFATRVPASLKMRGRKLRTFFKSAYAELLPREIRFKTKHGFGLPIPIWLRTDRNLNDMMRDLVIGPKSVQRGYFKRKALEALVEHHTTDDGSFYGTILWNLMVLELWHRNHFDQSPSN